jgi:hypothetical protein
MLKTEDLKKVVKSLGIAAITERNVFGRWTWYADEMR